MTNTFAGASLSIGTTAAAANLAAFEADTYTEIGELNNFGELGASGNIVTFPLVSDDFVKKAKGTRNAGDPVIVVGRVPDDEGQLALRAAEQTKYYYNFCLELEDAIDANHTNTFIYFRALVASAIIGTGGNEDFVTESYSLGIYPRPVIAESEIITTPTP